LTADFLPRIVSRMLAASRPVPKPANWQGVTEGLTEAQRRLCNGESGRARNILQDVLEFAPAEARAWHLLGKVLQSDGEHEEALNCFNTAASLYGGETPGQPNHPASLRLARMLWDQGDRLGACTMLDTLLQKSPDDPSLNELQAVWQQELGS